MIRGDIFSHIICLAQKGRAVGIHLVITTNRISSKVISGIIKDNVPTRMAFRVASKQDSRIQGAYVDLGDIDFVTRSISSQQSNGKRYNTPYCLPAVEDAEPECSGSGGSTDLHCLDDRFEDAAKLVVSTQIGAAFHLQLNLEIGYVKAA